ncbi:MAG: hypothetical protein GY711_15070 [bacterium]|nr:hypothetical protein [bacterium]
MRIRYYLFGKPPTSADASSDRDYRFLLADPPTARADFDRLHSWLAPLLQHLAAARGLGRLELVLPYAQARSCPHAFAEQPHGWVYLRVLTGQPADRHGRPTYRYDATCLTAGELSDLRHRPWLLESVLPEIAAWPSTSTAISEPQPELLPAVPEIPAAVHALLARGRELLAQGGSLAMLADPVSLTPSRALASSLFESSVRQGQRPGIVLELSAEQVQPVLGEGRWPIRISTVLPFGVLPDGWTDLLQVGERRKLAELE